MDLRHRHRRAAADAGGHQKQLQPAGAMLSDTLRAPCARDEVSAASARRRRRQSTIGIMLARQNSPIMI